jgi:hypothetical protein
MCIVITEEIQIQQLNRLKATAQLVLLPLLLRYLSSSFLVISCSSSLYCCYFFTTSQFWLLGSILLRRAILASSCSFKDPVHSPGLALRPLQTPAAICWTILTSTISLNTAILLAPTGVKHIRYLQYQTAKCFSEPPPPPPPPPTLTPPWETRAGWST